MTFSSLGSPPETKIHYHLCSVKVDTELIFKERKWWIPLNTWRWILLITWCAQISRNCRKNTISCHFPWVLLRFAHQAFEGLQAGKWLPRVQQCPICHVSFVIIFYFKGQHSINSMVSPSEDNVEMEQQWLYGGRTGNDVLLLYNLRKCYGGFSKKNTVVEGISLGIPRREVKRSFSLRM